MINLIFLDFGDVEELSTTNKPTNKVSKKHKLDNNEEFDSLPTRRRR